MTGGFSVSRRSTEVVVRSSNHRRSNTSVTVKDHRAAPKAVTLSTLCRQWHVIHHGEQHRSTTPTIRTTKIRPIWVSGVNAPEQRRRSAGGRRRPAEGPRWR
ncbi:hypothetical protein U1Q18_045300, partial [Sarracenia purpurea var. burkii]